MRSGVDHEERCDFGNPGRAARNREHALLQNVLLFVDAARTIPRKYPPGTVLEYKTLDTAVLGWLIERVSGGSNVSAYLAQRIWEPLGAEADGIFLMDGPPGTGREFTGESFDAMLRDLGRLGQMMLDGGFVNGRGVLHHRRARTGDGASATGAKSAHRHCDSAPVLRMPAACAVSQRARSCAERGRA